MGAQDPRDLTHSSRGCVCLHNIRPYATCPSHTYHCFPLPSFLLPLRLPPVRSSSSSSLSPPLPSSFVSLSREKERETWKGLSFVVDPHPCPDARTVPCRCPWRHGRPQGRVTLVRFAARIQRRKEEEIL